MGKSNNLEISTSLYMSFIKERDKIYDKSTNSLQSLTKLKNVGEFRLNEIVDLVKLYEYIIECITEDPFDGKMYIKDNLTLKSKVDDVESLSISSLIPANIYKFLMNEIDWNYEK